jgi:hypothetical protein
LPANGGAERPLRNRSPTRRGSAASLHTDPARREVGESAIHDLLSRGNRYPMGLGKPRSMSLDAG